MTSWVCLDVQVIGVVVAETEPLARRAAKAVKVVYEDLPAVISIEDAIECDSFYEQYGNALETGDLDAGFAGKALVSAVCVDSKHLLLQSKCCTVCILSPLPYI